MCSSLLGQCPLLPAWKKLSKLQKGIFYFSCRILTHGDLHKQVVDPVSLPPRPRRRQHRRPAMAAVAATADPPSKDSTDLMSIDSPCPCLMLNKLQKKLFTEVFFFPPGSTPNNTLRMVLCFLPWHLTTAYFVGRPLHYEEQQPQEPVPPPAVDDQNAVKAQVPGAFLQLCS